MNKLKRFEELKCWQAARGLVKEVYILCRKGELSKDFETKVNLSGLLFQQ